MWDNRETKKNPKAPDYKCRDKACDGVIWPPKPGQRSPVSAPPAKQGFSSGGPLPGEEEGPPVWDDTSSVLPSMSQLDAIFGLYSACFEFAYKIAHAKMGADCTHEGIAAMAATLFIQARK